MKKLGKKRNCDENQGGSMFVRVYSATEAPIRVFGMPLLYESGEWRKLPEKIIEQIPRLEGFRYTATGARVRFRTDAAAFSVRCTMRSIKPPADHSALSLTGISVYSGRYPEARYLGFVSMPEASEETVTVEKQFLKAAQMEEITLYLSSRSYIQSLEIVVDDSAALEPPTPYHYAKPIVFYGSSITAGGAASRAANNYVSLLSKWLDADVINMGFAGNARGDMPIAEYISQMEMSAFVYDYDHNARTVEELRNTHKPFFDVIRKCHPDLPILMLTRPYGDTDPADTAMRREVILETYHAARASGDRHVYFVDGQTLLGMKDRDDCTVDLIHPNDLGFMRMAEGIFPVLKQALESLA